MNVLIVWTILIATIVAESVALKTGGLGCKDNPECDELEKSLDDLINGNDEHNKVTSPHLPRQTTTHSSYVGKKVIGHGVVKGNKHGLDKIQYWQKDAGKSTDDKDSKLTKDSKQKETARDWVIKEINVLKDALSSLYSQLFKRQHENKDKKTDEDEDYSVWSSEDNKLSDEEQFSDFYAKAQKQAKKESNAPRSRDNGVHLRREGVKSKYVGAKVDGYEEKPSKQMRDDAQSSEEQKETDELTEAMKELLFKLASMFKNKSQVQRLYSQNAKSLPLNMKDWISRLNKKIQKRIKPNYITLKKEWRSRTVLDLRTFEALVDSVAEDIKELIKNMKDVLATEKVLSRVHRKHDKSKRAAWNDVDIEAGDNPKQKRDLAWHQAKMDQAYLTKIKDYLGFDSEFLHSLQKRDTEDREENNERDDFDDDDEDSLQHTQIKRAVENHVNGLDTPDSPKQKRDLAWYQDYLVEDSEFMHSLQERDTEDHEENEERNDFDDDNEDSLQHTQIKRAVENQVNRLDAHDSPKQKRDLAWYQAKKMPSIDQEYLAEGKPDIGFDSEFMHSLQERDTEDREENEERDDFDDDDEDSLQHTQKKRAVENHVNGLDTHDSPKQKRDLAWYQAKKISSNDQEYLAEEKPDLGFDSEFMHSVQERDTEDHEENEERDDFVDDNEDSLQHTQIKRAVENHVNGLDTPDSPKQKRELAWYQEYLAEDKPDLGFDSEFMHSLQERDIEDREENNERDDFDDDDSFFLQHAQIKRAVENYVNGLETPDSPKQKRDLAWYQAKKISSIDPEYLAEEKPDLGFDSEFMHSLQERDTEDHKENEERDDFDDDDEDSLQHTQIKRAVENHVNGLDTPDSPKQKRELAWYQDYLVEESEFMHSLQERDTEDHEENKERNDFDDDDEDSLQHTQIKRAVENHVNGLDTPDSPNQKRDLAWYQAKKISSNDQEYLAEEKPDLGFNSEFMHSLQERDTEDHEENEERDDFDDDNEDSLQHTQIKRAVENHVNGLDTPDSPKQKRELAWYQEYLAEDKPDLGFDSEFMHSLQERDTEDREENNERDDFDDDDSFFLQHAQIKRAVENYVNGLDTPDSPKQKRDLAWYQAKKISSIDPEYLAEEKPDLGFDSEFMHSLQKRDTEDHEENEERDDFGDDDDEDSLQHTQIKRAVENHVNGLDTPDSPKQKRDLAWYQDYLVEDSEFMHSLQERDTEDREGNDERDDFDDDDEDSFFLRHAEKKRAVENQVNGLDAHDSPKQKRDLAWYQAKKKPSIDQEYLAEGKPDIGFDSEFMHSLQERDTEDHEENEERDDDDDDEDSLQHTQIKRAVENHVNGLDTPDSPKQKRELAWYQEYLAEDKPDLGFDSEFMHSLQERDTEDREDNNERDDFDDDDEDSFFLQHAQIKRAVENHVNGLDTPDSPKQKRDLAWYQAKKISSNDQEYLAEEKPDLGFDSEFMHSLQERDTEDREGNNERDDFDDDDEDSFFLQHAQIKRAVENHVNGLDTPDSPKQKRDLAWYQAKKISRNDQEYLAEEKPDLGFDSEFMHSLQERDTEDREGNNERDDFDDDDEDSFFLQHAEKKRAVENQVNGLDVPDSSKHKRDLAWYQAKKVPSIDQEYLAEGKPDIGFDSEFMHSLQERDTEDHEENEERDDFDDDGEDSLQHTQIKRAVENHVNGLDTPDSPKQKRELAWYQEYLDEEKPDLGFDSEFVHSLQERDTEDREGNENDRDEFYDIMLGKSTLDEPISGDASRISKRDTADDYADEFGIVDINQEDLNAFHHKIKREKEQLDINGRPEFDEEMLYRSSLLNKVKRSVANLDLANKFSDIDSARDEHAVHRKEAENYIKNTPETVDFTAVKTPTDIMKRVNHRRMAVEQDIFKGQPEISDHMFDKITAHDKEKRDAFDQFLDNYELPKVEPLFHHNVKRNSDFPDDEMANEEFDLENSDDFMHKVLKRAVENYVNDVAGTDTFALGDEVPEVFVQHVINQRMEDPSSHDV